MKLKQKTQSGKASGRASGTAYGNYSDHIRIGHTGDAVVILEQLIANALDRDAKRALEAVKDALERGVI
jgi:hypothetical protein